MDPQEVVELARIRHNFACGMVGLMSKGKYPENVLLDLLTSHPIEGLVLDIHQCLNLLSEFKQFALQKYGNSPNNPIKQFCPSFQDVHFTRVHGTEFNTQ
ncbi:hypothetical protein AOL_s00006g590 [Orbilia oligospora ATCC 24927]|uniref:Uncharacterized protein n=2 Tax=Orbilia oligospora TaxID=2813651 RepID=G1X139_ARTOA|nr:hypothetical protein AOL_s00006g590 [Orbilia oligospora ATCC 24927]EGX53212.1 hypothetical protein AOL_s00006g590 [Orbilia oligospora ATCC 24927]KAF3291577.1 hypothetical protein TWF970_000791 [Orbilia oligospora]